MQEAGERGQRGVLALRDAVLEHALGVQVRVAQQEAMAHVVLQVLHGEVAVGLGDGQQDAEEEASVLPQTGEDPLAVLHVVLKVAAALTAQRVQLGVRDAHVGHQRLGIAAQHEAKVDVEEHPVSRHHHVVLVSVAHAQQQGDHRPGGHGSLEALACLPHVLVVALQHPVEQVEAVLAHPAQRRGAVHELDEAAVGRARHHAVGHDVHVHARTPKHHVHQADGVQKDLIHTNVVSLPDGAQWH
mmetsp:Transcript_39146/g.98668  ORF Transcript_39146/g.98668 Transcript_39146/m.98668 type:complete len:243 (+) Transcript_39146:341-1069(+)